MGEFRIYEFAWDRVKGRYSKQRRRFVGARLNEHTVLFVGNGARTAKVQLKSTLTSGFTRAATKGLDMEPLQVLEDAIANPALHDVGGAPQVVKVYRHLNAEPIPVIWPRGSGNATVAGRPTLPYEKTSAPPLSLDAPQLRYKHLR